MRLKSIAILFLLMLVGLYACNQKPAARKVKEMATYKGLYSYGPEVKSLKECKNGKESWVTDSSAMLELKYSQLNFAMPDEPVYVEVQGFKIKSPKDGLGSDYDSILVVKKLIKLSKEIPKYICN